MNILKGRAEQHQMPLRVRTVRGCEGIAKPAHSRPRFREGKLPRQSRLCQRLGPGESDASAGTNGGNYSQVLRFAPPLPYRP
jgi:hypothetical protein